MHPMTLAAGGKNAEIMISLGHVNAVRLEADGNTCLFMNYGFFIVSEPSYNDIISWMEGTEAAL